MPVYYPKANRTAAWYGNRYPGSAINPDKMVWHTTETNGRPGYGSGASAPHLTFDPKSLDWWQHFSLDRSARALRNESGGIETNTDGVIQVEIIAYSDETLAAQRGHLAVSDLSQAALRELGNFSAWLATNLDVPLRIDSGWVRRNYRNPSRMSYTQWRSFTGHTGHNRVPENTHWDPAALDIDAIMRYAGQTSPSPQPTPTPEDDDMPIYAVQRYGSSLYKLFTGGYPPITISEWDYNTLKAS
ncbi:MAG TPA: hypothetical protein VHK27_04900, partial [Gammaproteobacteria bacterium]|nr:hypothetical protein [Gammaproteobacteria bacterium]